MGKQFSDRCNSIARSGAQSAWKLSIQISLGVCRFQPGSVHSGSTWQLLHFAFPLNKSSRRAAASGSKLPHGRLRRRDCQLIKQQCLNLPRDLILVAADVLPVGHLQIAKPVRGGDRKLAVVQSWIHEPADSMHFQIADESVPISRTLNRDAAARICPQLSRIPAMSIRPLEPAE